MKRLYVTRLDLGQMLASAPADTITISLECWRYTLQVFPGGRSGVQINGVDVTSMVEAAGAANNRSCTYVERVGGAEGRTNDVKEQMNISGKNQLNAALIIERWMD